ncbi:MAG: hypothetical protein CVV27_02055 [Candidatus Melainabacteria bacterium HGW-Melainabacteria-1]|nr:MAG: hypothetical protein CVV27_02055 [Candidatus Melainabacteria bacterium HGW-Melainabacteria-1]
MNFSALRLISLALFLAACQPATPLQAPSQPGTQPGSQVSASSDRAVSSLQTPAKQALQRHPSQQLQQQVALASPQSGQPLSASPSAAGSHPTGSSSVGQAAPHQHPPTQLSPSPDVHAHGGGGGGGGGAAATAETPAQPPQPLQQTNNLVGDGWERWSDPATWNGDKPVAGDTLVIPAAKKILLDENTPDLAGLTIEGELMFAPQQDLELQADYIMLHGSLRAGSASLRHTGRATITLNAPDAEASVHGMGTRGILVMGGRLELYGQAPATVWTRISDHVPAGSTSMSLLSTSGWQAGDQIVLAPTDFYGVSQSERLQLNAVSAQGVGLVQGPLSSRWGRLQYLTSQGMSLNPEPGFAPRTPGTPTQLDERAAVGNLSRNIVIQGADDTIWTQQGFGAQVMVMEAQSVLALDGVELRRMGQAGRLGRYPIHFHMLSYGTGGGEIPAAGQRSVRNSAIWNSSNRCITLHGTNDAILDNNICYDISGHAIFLEDAVERRNQIRNNLVLRVRRPAQALLQSDLPDFQRGPSGFWLTNPDNVVTGNLAADAEGSGFWLAFPTEPLGLNRNVPIRPNRLPFGQFSHNVSHSHGAVGIQLDWVPFDAAGNTRPQAYAPSSDGGAAGPYANWVRFGLSDITTYKNLDSGFWNRATWPDYQRWISADNLGVFFAGAGADGNITQSLVVGQSLNATHTWQNVHPVWEPPGGRVPPVAFASYHSTFNLHRNSVVNFPFVSGRASGAFRTTDYYTSAVDRGLVRNPDNQLIQTHPGHREQVHVNENWALAGALWDPHGYWGPAGNYWVYDTPFLSAGATCQPVAPAGENGLSCQAEYYGVGEFVVDDSEQYMPLMPIRATRFDALGQVIGQWEVGDGRQAPMLGNMRHFAAIRGGRYLLEFPTGPVPDSRVWLTVQNAWRAQDSFLLGVSFSGAALPNVSLRSPYRTEFLTAADNLAAVEAGVGNLFWQDVANQRIWIRVRTPGAYPPPPAGEEFSDRNLYQSFDLRIERL